MKIEDVTAKDAKRLLEIYGPYVKNTAVSFEYEVPSVEEFENRIINITKKYPYIKIIDDENKTVGYAYASSFKSREAYKYDVEASIYLDQSQRGKGYGKALYFELEKRLKQIGIINVYACITMPINKSKYSTEASYHFHLRQGFKLVGTFKRCGYKFNEWFNIIWMEKQI